ncbi:MAG: hypothetical protein ACRDRX_19010 [Pseudonocardiaceae bacterium]
MSEVFHGYDERLDRRVAIKLLRPPSASIPTSPDGPETVEILDAAAAWLNPGSRARPGGLHHRTA